MAAADKILVPLGAGLWWANITTTPLVINEAYSSGIAQAVAAAILAIATLAASPYFTGRQITALTGATLVFCLLGLIVDFLPKTLDISAGEIDILQLCQSFGPTLLMLLWGTRFVSVSRTEAFSSVCRTAFVAIALHCLIEAALSLGSESALVQAIAFLDSSVLCILSAGILLFLQVRQPIPMTVREFKPQVRGRIGGFCAMRLLIGLVMGVLQVLPYLIAPSGTSTQMPTGLASLCLAVTATVCLGVELKHGRFRQFLPFIPLVGLVLPVLHVSDTAEALGLFYPSLWLAWIVLSSVQLSELKYEFSLSDLTLALGEKALIVVTALIGRLIGKALIPQLKWQASDSEFLAAYVIIMLLCCYASFTLSKLATMRNKEEVVREVVTNDSEQLEYIYRKIADDFGLSDREQQIFAYLARGHTRAYISNELGIAPGTVRAHINHIYQKIGCHSKEEAIALVGRYKTFNE